MKDERPTRDQLLADLTELRQRMAELERLEGEHHLVREVHRVLVEQSLLGILIVQDFRIVFANAAMAHISGLTIEQLTSLPPTGVQALVHPEDQALVWGRFQERLAGKPVPARYEYRGMHQDGSVRWLEMFAGRVEHGGRPAILGVVADVTERKQAEEALRESENLYRTLVETSPDAVVVTDLEANIGTVSRRALQLYGAESPNALQGKNALELLAPEDHERALANLQKTLTEGFSRRVEYTLLRQDGSHYTGELSAALIRDAAGDPQAFIGTIRDVSDRKRLEQQLEERRLYLEGVLSSAPDAIVALDAQGKVVEWNVGAERLFGYSSGEVLGRDIDDLVVRPDAREFEEARGFTGEALSGEDVPPTETVRYRKDGAAVDVIVAGSPILVRDRLAGIVAVYTDITGIRRAQEEARQRTAQMEALRQIGLELTAELDLDTLLHSIASRAVELLEGSWGGLFLHRPDRDVLEWAVAVGENPIPPGLVLHRGEGLAGRVWATGEPLTVHSYQDWQGRSATFEQFAIHAVASAPVHWRDRFLGVLNVVTESPRAFSPADAEILGLFAAQAAIAIENARLYQELHDRAEKLEERVRERTAEVRAQYAWLEAILGSTADGIIVTDAAGEVVLANPVARGWLYYDLASDDAAELWQAVRHVARHAEDRSRASLELTGVDLELQAALVQVEGLEEPTVVVDIRDVTHLKALDRMKTRFVSNVSHELRTPVTTIKLYAALLQKRPERWEEYLEHLQAEADRQARLVEDILQVSGIDAGRIELRPERTPVNALAQATVAANRVLAQDQGLELEYRPLEPGPIAVVDPERMGQVLNNLVENAIWYTPQGGEVVVSTGRAEAEGQAWATATVQDTGIGIPEEELPHLFERFFRGEKVRQMQISGTGLGLAIVEEIVHLHGGRVTVESRLGEGSTFTVWLPLADG